MRFSTLAFSLAICFMVLQPSICRGVANGGLSLLHGYIYEISDDYQRPVASALISVYDRDSRVLVSGGATGRDGSYSFHLRSGMYTMRVDKSGYVEQGVFVILKANPTLRLDFYLEKGYAPYEAQVLIEGLPENVYPELLLDGNPHGWSLNGSNFLFMKNTSHTMELGEIPEDRVRYVLVGSRSHTFTEAETKVFQYSRQFYVNSSTDPWRNGWYDEGSVPFEARPIIDLGNATRLVFDTWIVDGTILGENPSHI